jgi:hypothetical protein
MNFCVHTTCHIDDPYLTEIWVLPPTAVQVTEEELSE